MSILGLLFTLLLTLIAIAIVAHPLLGEARSSMGDGPDEDDQEDRIGNYYERILTNIRDLDEDLATGKIGGEDHGREREVWVARGIALLRLQDQLDVENISKGDSTDSEAIDRAIEAAVAAYREGKLPTHGEEIK